MGGRERKEREGKGGDVGYSKVVENSLCFKCNTPAMIIQDYHSYSHSAGVNSTIRSDQISI